MEPRIAGRPIKLFIYSHFFPPSVGGVETIVLSLAQGLAGLSGPTMWAPFEVTIVTETPAGQFDDRLLNFRVIRQPSPILLLRLVLECDVMHLAGPSLLPQFLGYLARKPIVLEHHGYQATCPNGLLIRQPERSVCPGHFLQRQPLQCLKCQMAEMPLWRSIFQMFVMVPRYFVARSASVNISITNHVLDRQHLPKSKTIYYGIEDRFPIEVRTPQKDSKQVCFAYVGRFVPEKGIPVFLKSISLLKKEGLDFRVKLVGDGPQRAEIDKIVQSEAIADRVTITGFLKGDALSQALENVSAVVMPSVWEETAGLAAIEQMMTGRLVIASQIGGLAEVVSTTGLLSPAGDAEALAERMKMVIQNPGLIETLGKSARARALELFQRGRMVEDHAKVYRQLVRQ
jgi:glycosyltransferase involved in cell wall biosynthesis